MAAYQYQALDPGGNKLTGVIDAETPRLARGELRQRNLLPIEVTPVSDSVDGLRRNDRLSSRQRVLLTRQWASLLAAGLTITDALHGLIGQHEEPTVRRVLGGVRAEVMAGCPLHRALSIFPRAFPPLYVALVKAGEASGELPRVLDALAAYQEQQTEVKRRTFAALLYPAMVSVVGLLIIFALMVYVVPQVTAVFAHGRQELPLLTRLLITISHYTLPAALAVPPLCWLFARFARRALQDAGKRRKMHARLLRLPLLGSTLRSAEAARFAATLGILVGGGVPLLHALGAGRAVLRFQPSVDAVDGTLAAIAEGSSLARGLASEKAFPSLLTHLVAGGEKTGRLAEMLGHAATLMQADVDERLATLVALLEPLLILLMGGLVLLVVLAIMQPILEVNQLLR